MFALCDQMKWAHLPEPGGLYAQDPKLLDGFRYIFAMRSQAEAEDQKRREREQKSRQSSNRGKRRR